MMYTSPSASGIVPCEYSWPRLPPSLTTGICAMAHAASMASVARSPVLLASITYIIEVSLSILVSLPAEQVAGQFPDGAGAVADGVLHLHAQLGEGLPVAVGAEHRVIAEALGA